MAGHRRHKILGGFTNYNYCHTDCLYYFQLMFDGLLSFGNVYYENPNETAVATLTPLFSNFSVIRKATNRGRNEKTFRKDR